MDFRYVQRDQIVQDILPLSGPLMRDANWLPPKSVLSVASPMFPRKICCALNSALVEVSYAKDTKADHPLYHADFGLLS
ncbi:unnamed protein product [Periconia digitata]|uniref:Uncharacterized protein n=1 Tax=Periconia digitata TaxID=1303443 RepID=A0A9W4UXK4_9PLEO|nr:unnamed protein product [Periconia digitata]